MGRGLAPAGWSDGRRRRRRVRAGRWAATKSAPLTRAFANL